MTVLLGDGKGHFGAAAAYPVAAQTNAQTEGYILSIPIGDFNGDGKPDIAVALGGMVQVLLGNGDGTFTLDPVLAVVGGGTPHAVAGDFNGDSKIDLAVTLGSAAAVAVLTR